MNEHEKALYRARLEQVGRKMVADLQDEVFAADGASKSIVDMDGRGTYRNKPLFIGQEFFLRDSYVGKKDQLVLKFEPVDKQEWKYAEFDTKTVDSGMPMFTPTVAEHYGIKTESFTTLCAVLVSEQIKAEEEEAREKERKRKEEEAALEAELGHNELWGRF